MPGQTLYEILEVRQTASQVAIRAAWERLSAQWDPIRPYNSDAEARTRYAAIKDAYSTLGNPQKRVAYDKRLNLASKTPVSKRSGAIPKFAVVLLAALAVAAYNYSGQREQPRIDAPQGVAAAKDEVNEAESKAKIELAYVEQQRERQQRLKDAGAHEQREADLARFAAKQRVDEAKVRAETERAKLRTVAKENMEGTRTGIAARDKDPDAPVTSQREHRDRSDVLAMKLDTEFASGHKLFNAPLTQNLTKH